ncbi:pitrilysin family protein [Methylobacterium sp. 1030]|uniref:M16 family metallopeptidase n=1 Tax=Methylobacterium sp. 1030 TaxID=3156404 RepID=UPI003395F6F0
MRSPGGIEAWLIEDHALPILSVNFGFRGGANLDVDERAGTAAMLGSLLTEGAGSMTATAFQQALGNRAIRMTFGVTPDLTWGDLRCMVRHADRAFEMLGLALREPRLAPEAIERARARMAAALRAAVEKPEYVAGRAFAAEGFAGHPYARAIMGESETIQAITCADLLALHPRLVSRSNLRIGVVGAIDPDRLGPLLDRAFADLPSPLVPPVAQVTLRGLGRRVLKRMALPQSTLVFGRPGLPRHDPDFLASVVVNLCLGGGFTSRLFKEVREKRGLCYAINSSLAVTDGSATLRSTTSTRNDRTAEVIDVVMGEFRRLVAQGIGEEELARTKGNLIGSHCLQLSNSGALANALLTIQLDGRDPDWLDRRNSGIASVGIADARRASERLLGDGSLFVVVCGDPPED